MSEYHRIDAEEDTSVRTDKGVGDGENVMTRSVRRWNTVRRSLRKERAKPEEWPIGSISGDSLDARCVGSRGYAHAAALGNGDDSPCVERLNSIVYVDARLHAVEADHTN